MVERRSRRPRPGLVEHRHRQAEPGDQVLSPGGGQMGGTMAARIPPEHRPNSADEATRQIRRVASSASRIACP